MNMLASILMTAALSLAPAQSNDWDRPIPTCKSEDGSYLNKAGKVRYQTICVWDARRLGNKRGNSFLMTQNRKGENWTLYRISHRTAYDLTH